MKKQAGDFFTVQLPLLRPPKADLFEAIGDRLNSIVDGDIIFVTTKILALHQGRCVKAEAGVNKDDLAKASSDYFLKRDPSTSYPSVLAIIQGVLMPTAGIDESNADGYFILWPEDTSSLLLQIRAFFIKKYGLKRLGVVATDTRSNPLQIGTSGIAVACCGFHPLRTYIGSGDLFGRPFSSTRVNFAQSLSAMAVFLMGEGTERTPIVVYRPPAVTDEASFKIEYHDRVSTQDMLLHNPRDDIFYPILRPIVESGD